MANEIKPRAPQNVGRWTATTARDCLGRNGVHIGGDGSISRWRGRGIRVQGAIDYLVNWCSGFARDEEN